MIDRKNVGHWKTNAIWMNNQETSLPGRAVRGTFPQELFCGLKERVGQRADLRGQRMPMFW